ncbi:hypothetical protein BDA99DRAFT_521727 [Phascolomyces articulosus]|uniref:RRM domain-containing protein n=1 Tax=Phascolomyces articulosus TaxID=60185 RepID=A0AAD5P9U1_9FUNG|nr:hypothetical protein BDA99DRAFT_521727 [Phascolomyces articulosus]
MHIPSEPTPRLVIVKNVAPDTTESMLTDFFSFCGKIEDFSLNNDTTAYILFERQAAAKTAILLNNATVNGRELVVEPYFEEVPAVKENEEDHPDEREQEAKTKSNVMAELLAAGYKLTDPILQAASDVDKKYGVWNRVEPYWNQVDQKIHVADTVHSMEDSADHWLKESAMGQKIQHHLVDPITSIHTEARRIVNEQQGSNRTSR